MSQQAISVLSLPILASGAVTEYRAVGFNGAQATTAGQKVLGISEHGAASGGYVRVCRLGTAVAEAGGAITVGSALAVDSSGRVTAASTLTAAVGTLAITAGATAVTSSAANGAGTVTGAPTLSGGDPPQYIVGYALQAAAAAGDLIEIAMA